MENGQLKRWETGIDRVAELSLLKPDYANRAVIGQDIKSHIRHVTLKDMWE